MRLRLPGSLLAIVLGVTTPLLLFGAVLVWQFDARERGKIEGEMQSVAQSLSLAVDR